MQFTLICLYDKGRRLSNEELADAPRYTGNLIIEDTWRESGHGRRYFRIAKLLELGHNASEQLSQLMDPVVTMTTQHMMLSGYEIIPTETRPIHYAQAWLLKAAEQER